MRFSQDCRNLLEFAPETPTPNAGVCPGVGVGVGVDIKGSVSTAFVV